MVVYVHSDVFGSGDTSYDRNSAVDIAGAVLVLDNCTVSWSGETIFSSNKAQNYEGGALVVHDSFVAF